MEKGLSESDKMVLRRTIVYLKGKGLLQTEIAYILGIDNKIVMPRNVFCKKSIN